MTKQEVLTWTGLFALLIVLIILAYFTRNQTPPASEPLPMPVDSSTPVPFYPCPVNEKCA